MASGALAVGLVALGMRSLGIPAGELTNLPLVEDRAQTPAKQNAKAIGRKESTPFLNLSPTSSAGRCRGDHGI